MILLSFYQVRYSPQLLADGGLLVQQSPSEEDPLAAVPIPRSEHASSPNQQWPVRKQVNSCHEAPLSLSLSRASAKLVILYFWRWLL